MRIISKFHDYYDMVAGYGLDPTLVYRRDPGLHERLERLWTWDKRVLPFPNDRWISRLVPLQSATLAFCGRIYPVWIDSDLPFVPESFVTHTNLGKVHDVAQAAQIVKAREYSEYWRRDSAEAYVRVIEELARKTTGTFIDPAVFREFGSPVLLMRRVGDEWDKHAIRIQVITNPRLATLGFERAWDPFTAFQEIATYLGMMGSGEDLAPRTVGGDEVVAASKGFDSMSFRTAAPGAKKLNRRANRQRKLGKRFD